MKNKFKDLNLLEIQILNKKAAYTLAEVLITLGIIGVVAAITLSTVINNIQGRQLQTALKKSYSTINQALDMYYVENGERYVKSDQAGILKQILMKYIKNVKDCGRGTGNKDCIYAYNRSYDTFNDIYKNFNGTNIIQSIYFDDGQFIINDGSLVMIEDELSTIRNRKYISIDINGYKKRPNRLGQDVFMFQIMTDGKLLPMGADGTNYPQKSYCSLTSTDQMNGAGCTVKALSDKDFFKNLPK